MLPLNCLLFPDSKGKQCCDTYRKLLLKYILSETKYKMKRCILKIGEPEIAKVLPLQRNVLSNYKNLGFPPPYFPRPQWKKVCVVHTKNL